MVDTSFWLDRANPRTLGIYDLFDSATHLSPIPQQWSDSSQALSARPKHCRDGQPISRVSIKAL